MDRSQMVDHRFGDRLGAGKIVQALVHFNQDYECQFLICICKMRCGWRFIRPSPVSGRAKDDVGSV